MRPRRFIYFLRRTDGDGPIKIGCASAPSMRLHQLEFDLRTKLTILAEAPGGFTVERNIHHKFRKHRAELTMRPDRPTFGAPTEWFEPVPELLAFIEAVKSEGVIPLPDSERLEAIFLARWKAGETLRAIGADFGLSHERVRQVLNEQGCETSRGRKAA